MAQKSISTNPLADKLKGKIPDFVHAQLTQVSFDGLTPLRLAHFLAQCDHESGGFKQTVENTNYSAAGLLATFGKRFQGVSEQYARKPVAIANRAYADRLGNGDEASGDGNKFKGRGFIMLTGRDNYNRAGICLGVDFIKNPDFVAQGYALTVALWFFKSNKIWDVCTAPTEQAVIAVTRRVNGGTIGLEDRIKCFNKYWAILSK
jgi:putative chitinase